MNEFLEALLNVLTSAWSWVRDDWWPKVFDSPSDWIYLGLGAWALLRATAVTVDTGETGLFYSFGRAKRVLQPGVQLLIPFLQIVRKLPARSRTLHLPAQRVSTREGLVFDVDANIVYRVTDIRRALIEVDHLERGMRQALSLSVVDVLRGRAREAIRRGPELDHELAFAMRPRLLEWGVEIERAGFLTLTPSAESLRVTQLGPRTRERTRVSALLPLMLPDALTLLGPRERFQSRARARRADEAALRRRHRLTKKLMRLGVARQRVRGTEGALRRGEIDASSLEKAG